MKLKDVILSYRRENNMSQREFARRAGLSNSLISIIENGINPQTGKKMNQDFKTYKKIADAMGISPSKLLNSIDDEEAIELRNDFSELDPRTIYYSDNKIVRKTLTGMALISPIDYEVVMEIFERTEQELKKRGDWDNL